MGGIYTSSKNEQKDTADMATPYLKSALNKAIEQGNQDNIDVLEAELASRQQETSEEIDTTQ